MLRAHPVVLALCVFVGGFALIWAGFSPLNEDPLLFCPGGLEMDERSSLSTEPALWPPGTTRCEYTTAQGVSSSRIFVPWRDWVSLALFAAAVGVAAAGRLVLAAGLVLAAFAASFV